MDFELLYPEIGASHLPSGPVRYVRFGLNAPGVTISRAYYGAIRET